MTIETINIKDWIESDFAKSLESEEAFEKWKLFEIVPSDGAYELYDNEFSSIQLINVVYAIGIKYTGIDSPDFYHLKKQMGKTLIALRDSAIAIKLEGEVIGKGKLIIQDRLGIFISKDPDFDEYERDSFKVVKEGNRYKIMWYGVITKIPRGFTHKPREQTNEA